MLKTLCQFLLLFCFVIQAFAVADPDELIMPTPDARELFRSAATISAQNPVNLLISVVKNTNYEESPSPTSNSPSNFLNNPVQAVSNLLTGNNVGLGLSVHF